MVAISFKSVGEKTETHNQRLQNEVVDIPIGIVTPVRAGTGTDGIFRMHRSIAAQIHDNFRNLLLTNRGDRVIQTDIGADLQRLAMELTSVDNFDNDAMLRIKRTASKYMPFIVLDSFESKIINDEEDSVGRINIMIKYNVPSRKIIGQSLELNFFLGG